MEQGTSQPEAVRALGEKSVVVIDREAGFPDSHQVRPLHLQVCSINGVLVLCNTTLQYNVCFTASVWNYVKATKEYADFTCSLENI